MTTSPTNNMDVKRRNRINTLRCILKNDRVSQMELTQRLGLSWPTILQNVKELTELGLVREDGVYASTGGRKAKAYAPVRDARVAVGVEVARDHVSVVLTDLSGNLLRQAQGALRFSPEEIYFKYLGGLLQRFVDAGGAGDRLLGVGLAIPGVVDEERGLLRDSRALDLRNVPLSRFTQQIPWPCRCLGAAGAAGLAESYGAENTGDLIYLSLGEMVGGAILREGELYQGNHLRAGEFGHATLVPGGRRCRCGKEGCLDAYCSAKVLADCAGGSLPAFFEELRSGDAEKRETWREYLEYLAAAVNNLHIGFDCDVMAGGEVGAYLEEFGELLRALLAERNPFDQDTSYLRYGRRPREAAAVGAALIQVEAFLQGL